MVSRADWRWFLSKSHAATTWTSLRPRSSLVLPGPCMPQPTTPTAMRPEGAVVPARPKALAGMKVGAARARLVAARKWRREMPDLKEESFMEVNQARRRGGRREENAWRRGAKPEDRNPKPERSPKSEIRNRNLRYWRGQIASPTWMVPERTTSARTPWRLFNIKARRPWQMASIFAQGSRGA